MKWVWPARKNEQSGMMIRLGRFLHWLSIAIAAYGMVFGWVAMFTDAGDRASVYSAVVVGLTIAVPVMLLGRGLRYVLAGE